MKADLGRINVFLSGPHRYVIPVFQRYYIWSEANWKQLWDDLDELCETDPTDKQSRKHFLGSIVSASDTYEPGTTSSLQVIDGQQRLTTLSLLFCAIRDLARERDKSSPLAEEINDTCLVHKHNKKELHYRLFPRQRDRHVYLALVDKGPGAVTDRSSQMYQAYEFHRAELKKYELVEEGPKSLRRVFEVGATRLEVVSIVLEKEDDPFQIFSSLNSTGVDLEAADLIRNEVFMQLDSGRQDEFDDNHWQNLEAVFNPTSLKPASQPLAPDQREAEIAKAKAKENAKLLTEFFRDQLMSAGNYVKETATYREFKAKYGPTAQGKENALEPIEPRLARLVDSLTKQAKIYQTIRGVERAATVQITRALELIRELGMRSAYPLVLQCMTLHAESKISDAALVTNLLSIAGFFLRRSVCGKSSRSYSQWFCAWSGKLLCGDPAEMAMWLKEQDWPSDEEFVDGFTRFDMYKNKLGKTVLLRIEKESQHPDERVLLEQCQVEHVMPQTILEGTEDGKAWMEALGAEFDRIRNKWLHTPGNLTLVGADYNNGMRNKSFTAKAPVLRESAVKLNRYFRSVKAWNEEAIMARAKVLGECAAKIWYGPDTTPLQKKSKK